jgi:hypothetical protein
MYTPVKVHARQGEAERPPPAWLAVAVFVDAGAVIITGRALKQSRNKLRRLVSTLLYNRRGRWLQPTSRRCVPEPRPISWVPLAHGPPG